jgi:hypothetical protein
MERPLACGCSRLMGCGGVPLAPTAMKRFALTQALKQSRMSAAVCKL